MIVFENDQILIVEKPTGIPAHRSDEGRTGFVEWLTEKRGQPFFLIHRLDADTSGLMMLAKTSEAARIWSADFSPAETAVKKTYRFLTDQAGVSAGLDRLTVITWSSLITREGSRWTSKSGSDVDPNSRTHFKFIREIDARLFEWEARIETGKTHQIRLHAQDLGIPILGDPLYGGQNFSRLCLHATSLEIPKLSQKIESVADWDRIYQKNPPAHTFDHAQMNLTLLSWCLAYQNRLRFLSCVSGAEKMQTAFRVLHEEDFQLRADRLGEVLWGYWYDPHPPGDDKLELFNQFALAIECKHWTMRWMKDRGRPDYEKVRWDSTELPVSWLAYEDGIPFEFRSDTGSSPGLFLDQRANRRWTRANAENKRVLNLFCYTSGFGLMAALGDASAVVNVDVQKSVLDWSRRNFELNHLPVKDEKSPVPLIVKKQPAEFWKADSFYFLERTVARKRKFDLIICDPPSFARNERGLFRIDRNLPDLLQLICRCLSPGGQIILTTNFEGWNQFHFLAEIRAALPMGTYHLQKLPAPDGDFEKFSQASDREPILKSCLITAGV